MRSPALLLPFALVAGAALHAQSGPPPAPFPAWLMPPPPRPSPPIPLPGQAQVVPAMPNAAGHPFIPGGTANLPLGIYANPLMIYAIRGMIGQLVAHPPPPPGYNAPPVNQTPPPAR
jgi:hypothetical protein